MAKAAARSVHAGKPGYVFRQRFRPAPDGGEAALPPPLSPRDVL